MFIYRSSFCTQLHVPYSSKAYRKSWCIFQNNKENSTIQKWVSAFTQESSTKNIQFSVMPVGSYSIYAAAWNLCELPEVAEDIQPPFIIWILSTLNLWTAVLSWFHQDSYFTIIEFQDLQAHCFISRLIKKKKLLGHNSSPSTRLVEEVWKPSS